MLNFICIEKEKFPNGIPTMYVKQGNYSYVYVGVNPKGDFCYKLVVAGASSKKKSTAPVPITCSKSFFMLSGNTVGFLADTASLLDSNLAGSNNFSFSFWDIIISSAPSNSLSYGRKSNASGQFVVFRTPSGSGSKISLRLYTTNTVFSTWTTANFIPFGAWVHVVATYDASLPLANRVHIYLNGVDEVLTKVDTAGGLTTIASDATLPLRIHRSTAPNTGFTSLYDFQLNRIMFWNNVISSAEATALYNSGNGIDERVNSGAYTDASNLLVWYCAESATFDTAWRWSSGAGSLGSTQLSSFAMTSGDRVDLYPPLL